VARTASPWFRAERNAWYVIRNDRRHCLGDHPADAPKPRKKNGKWVVPQVIQDRYHELMASPVVAAGPPLRPTTALSVVEVFENFLEWCEKNRSPRTYEWSRDHIQGFLDSLPQKRLPADDLRPFHVTEWADGKPRWGPNHRRGAISAVQRAFSWAEKQGYLLKSPIRHVEKPAPQRREQVLTPAEFSRLLTRISDGSFRDVLEFCWETGARVQEVRLLETAHFKPERGRFEIPPAQAKGKRRWRIIYLTDRAREIGRRLSGAHPEGPIFRNADGNPWDAQNFNCRFVRLQVRLGREELERRSFHLSAEEVAVFAHTLNPNKQTAGKVVPKSAKELLREARKKLTARAAVKLGIKYALTTIRHSFATRLLEAGVDHLTVSALLGHADGTMLAKVYSHIGQKTDFLQEELLRASRGESAA
jgi:integrase